jgi:hypothetical protein
MTPGKVARRARATLAAVGVCGLLLFALAGGAQAQGSPNAPGATTPAQAQTIEGGAQQLSAPAGQSLAAPTQDSYQGVGG